MRLRPQPDGVARGTNTEPAKRQPAGQTRIRGLGQHRGNVACHGSAANILEWPPMRSQQIQNASLSTKREFVDWIKTVVVPDLQRRFPMAS